VPCSHPREHRLSTSRETKHVFLRSVPFWVITQRIVVIPYRRFRTTCRSHLQLSRRWGPISCPETSVSNYYWFLHNNLEERSSHLLRGGSLKSRKEHSHYHHRHRHCHCLLILFFFLFFFIFFWSSYILNYLALYNREFTFKVRLL
jgi:hypothetical protein